MEKTKEHIAKETLRQIIDSAFKEYEKKKDTITRGFISGENVEWVTERLLLRGLTDKGLSAMWEAVDKYFLELTAEFDADGNVCNWKPNKEFEFDTDSAWKEVINAEARRRKAMNSDRK